MLSDFFEKFYVQNWLSEPDGLGGFKWALKDGVEFDAGISTDNSREARIAYKNGTKTMYTIAFQEILPLEQDDIVRRVKDNRLYRITSNAGDMETPDIAEVKFAQVNAEVIENAKHTTGA